MSTDAATADATPGTSTAVVVPMGVMTAAPTRVVATVYLAASLVTLFPGAPRRLEVEAATVAALVDGLNARWPGMRDRLCAPGPSIRRHINIFVDGERSTLATTINRGSVVHVIPAVSGG